MFIINNNEIDNEFSKTFWAADYKRAMAVDYKRAARTIYGNSKQNRLDKHEEAFAETFFEIMRDALCYAKNNEQSIRGYLTVRKHIRETKMSPGDFEYGIFGNIAANTIDSNIDIDELTSFGYIPAITKIVSNEPDTVVYFNDDTKVVVHCSDKETFDVEKGIYLAILKKALGSPNLQHLFTLIADKCEAKSSTASAENVDESDTEVFYSTNGNGEWCEESCCAE